MFGKMKTAKEILKLIAGMSDEEKAALLEALGASEEPAASDGTGGTPEEVAEETSDNDVSEDVEEAEAETAEEDISEEDVEEVAEDTADEGAEEAPPATDPVEETPEEDPIAALTARLAALESGYEERIKSLEDFVQQIKGEDAKEKGDLGYQQVEEARSAASESYRELRKRVVGE